MRIPLRDAFRPFKGSFKASFEDSCKGSFKGSRRVPLWGLEFRVWGLGFIGFKVKGSGRDTSKDREGSGYVVLADAGSLES